MAMMRLRREDPRIVGPYRLHRRLGAGGMGVVYLGSDRRGQRVALKLIRAELAEDAEFRTRFAREIAAASKIRGGCTARVVGSDIEADRPWLATAYVPGPSLYKRVGEEGPLPWPETARIGSALADGLVKVHEAGVVHRDLKPSNILLSPKGPRIIDFGIAWSRGASTLTHVGTAVGSPGFLAPEQVRGAAVTPATDVFAFGATLAYALTGDSPFGSGASSEVMLYRVVHEEPDLSAVPAPLAPLVRACLAKEPTERPGAAALHERLSELAARGAALGGTRARGAAGSPAAEPARPAVPPPPQRRPHGQSATAPMPRPDLGDQPREHARDHVREHARDRAAVPAGGRAAGARDRQHTPTPGRPVLGRPAGARQRLARQRAVVFVTVTVGVALAIAAAQGCENRSKQGMPPGPAGSVPSASAPVSAAGSAPPAGLSVDGVQPPAAPFAAVARGTGDPALGPAVGSVPAVDWPNRSYTDPAGGAAIRLRDGHSTAENAQIALSTVLPARYRDAPAALVVLRRAEGAVPVDLVELFGFSGDTPVLLAARASAADAQAVAAWRIEGGALIRDERVSQTGAGSSTRYSVRADGTLDESWPGAAVSGGSTGGAGGSASGS
ncbi:hypothetical protein GCM10009760_26310 [Kitasatospora kazusensis]|uniref:Protein kinase domain-containing protein n=1 Tax=Kitasatospora kazusensis TaxID=407974 RepID=A0ABN2ZGU5_9ACTN